MINVFVTARKWPEFVDRFAVPKDWPHMERRIMTNIQYYWQNYAILSLVLSCIVNISSFRTLFFILSMVTAWIYVLFIIRPVPGLKKSDLMQPPGQYSDVVSRIASFPLEQRALGMLVASFLISLSFRISFRIAASVLLSVCVCLLHAIMRPENMKAKAFKFHKNAKGLIGKILSPPKGYDKGMGVAVPGGGTSMSQEEAVSSVHSGASTSYPEQQYQDIESVVGSREDPTTGAATEFRQRVAGRSANDPTMFSTPPDMTHAFGTPQHPSASVDNLPRPGKTHIH